MSKDIQASEKTIEKPSPKTRKFVDFEIKREGWNLYRIEDGTLLRARVIIAGIMLEKDFKEIVKQLRPGQRPRLGLSLNPKAILSVESPPRLRGEPDSKTYTSAELKAFIVNEDMDFETTREVWNLYELENGIKLKVRTSVVAVNKTSKFDGMGMPIYSIDSSTDVKFELPDHIRKTIGEKTKVE